MRQRILGKARRWMPIVMVAFMALIPQNVRASVAVDAKIQDLEIEKDQFTVYIDQKQGEDFDPVASSSSASLGGQECKVLKCENLEEAKLGVVYDCIVDVSGSMDKARMEEVKKMLTQLVEDRKPEDLIRITKMANERESTDFLTDSEELLTIISELKVTHEDTNFYNSLKKEAEELIGNNDLPRRRCILVFSDGVEDQQKGITKEEALNAVTNYDIPVFTVAMMKKKSSNAEIEAAKELGNFGRSSYGGVHFAPQVDHSEYDQIIETIRAIGNDSLVVTIDTSRLKMQRKAADLHLKLVSGGFVSEIEYQLDQESAIKMLLSGEEEYVETESDELAYSSEEQSEIASSEEDGKESVLLNNRVLLIIVVVCAIIMIIAIVFVLIFVATSSRRDKTGLSGKRLEITLTRKVDQVAVTKSVSSRLSFGRGKRCDISFPNDQALSDVHCMFIYDQPIMYIQDNGSTNGVFVNGIPQLGKCALSQGDVVLIGSHEYCVTWR